MLAPLLSALLWTLVAASATFWGFKLFANEPAAPTDMPVRSSSVSNLPNHSELARLLGGTALVTSASGRAPSMNSRFHLAAVIASPLASGAGVALIAVDGKKARVFRVGAPIDGDMVLQSVGFRSASIGIVQGAPAVVLELQALPLPSSGPLRAPAPFVASAGPLAQDAGVVPATPSIRKAAPGERSPGRRLRLQRRGVGALPED
jgi:general secretion pathway protein C